MYIMARCPVCSTCIHVSEKMEEDLREASCVGNLIAVKQLVEKGVSVNAQNTINGWAPLHWACKRGHIDIVRYLLQSGSNVALLTCKGEQPRDVTSNTDIIQLLDATLDSNDDNVSAVTEQHRPVIDKEQLTFVPNYLKYPIFPYSTDKWSPTSITSTTISNDHNMHSNGTKTANESVPLANDISQLSISDNASGHILVKVRVANSGEEDFIEVETDRLTYAGLLKAICVELEVSVNDVVKIRKLPNVLIRKDKDVARLLEGQELEVVLIDNKNNV